MQLERTPQPGQIWQHYKGNDYKIILVTGSKPDWTNESLATKFSIKHSETQKDLMLVLGKHSLTELYLAEETDKSHLFPHELITEPHVIYQRVDPTFPQVWARPLDNLLEIISSPYNEGAVSNNYARFNRIK